MGYLFLTLATVSCVAGSSFLTASDGMRLRKYGALGVFFFVLSYVLFSRCILYMQLSVAYAIFCGAGIILSSVVSRVLFKQKVTKIGLFCMALILVACVIIHLYGSV